MKPTNCDLQVDIISSHLEGKTIALCVCGGIAAIEAPKVARMLRRHGAAVKIYATPSAFKFIGEAALQWATGQDVVSQLSGLAEHICEEDLVLVTPATLNTVNKIRYGLADTVVTTLIQSAMGQHKPIMFCPTMHESLDKNPIYQESKKFLSEISCGTISFIEPRREERKAKAPKVSTIAAEVCHTLNAKNSNVLITAGPTPVRIDDVRVITNIFKGTLGIEIARYAYHQGFEVHLLLGSSGKKAPDYIKTTIHRTYEEYRDNVVDNIGPFPQKQYDYGIFSAAVADWKPEIVHKGKISSKNGGMPTSWVNTEKVIDLVLAQAPEMKLVSFKVESDLSVNDLDWIAHDRLEKGHHMVVGNRLEDMANKQYTGYIYLNDGEKEGIRVDKKGEMARAIVEQLT